MSYKMIPCPSCEGSGQVAHPRSYGRYLRRRRLAAHIGLRQMARTIGISAAWLVQLEAGASTWPKRTTKRFLKVVLDGNGDAGV